MPDKQSPLCTISDHALLELACGGRGRSGGRRVADAEPLDLGAVLVEDPTEIGARFGLTSARARRLWALGEVHRRLVSRQAPVRCILNRPESVYDLMAPRLAGLEVETFWALALDARSRLIGDPVRLTVGDVDGTEAGPRVFMRAAVRRGAVSAVAVHNHPSGDPQPSAADVAVTRRLATAGRAVDVPLVDHVVIGQGEWSSIRRDHPDCFV